MRDARLILDLHDDNHRPVRRTIADGIARLEEEFGNRAPPPGQLYLSAPSGAAQGANFAAICFRPEEGQGIVIPFPFSSACRAQTSLGVSIRLNIGELDGARLDTHGNVELRDGRFVHGLDFDILPRPKDFTDVEHAIVLLSIRLLGAEEQCIRRCPYTGVCGIDYGVLSQLTVGNVKVLAHYIDANIANQVDGVSALPLRTIHRTLDLAGIRKSQGRRPTVGN